MSIYPDREYRLTSSYAFAGPWTMMTTSKAAGPSILQVAWSVSSPQAWTSLAFNPLSVRAKLKLRNCVPI